MKPPQNVAFLDRALRALSKTNEEGVQLRRVMANVIVGQFMEGAVMRGGGSLKLRYGLGTTRYTMDFDAARSVTEDGAFAVVELVGHFVELLDFLNGVGEVLGEYFGLTFVDGGLCRGRAGVDD